MLARLRALAARLLDTPAFRIDTALLQPDDLPSMERERRLEGLGR